MAWSAPTEWERWDPEQLLVCPYDPVHRIPAKRFQYHILKCRKNYPDKDFITCPFNAKHIVLRPELRHHISRCPDKTVLDGDPSRVCDNVKDDEGFYFKGNTTLPISTWQAPDDDDENWDTEDSTIHQLCPVNTEDLLPHRMTEAELQHQELCNRESLKSNVAHGSLVNGSSLLYGNRRNNHQLSPDQTESSDTSSAFQGQRMSDGYFRQQPPQEEASLLSHRTCAISSETSLSPYVQPSGRQTVFSLSLQQAYDTSRMNEQSLKTPLVSDKGNTVPQVTSIESIISKLSTQSVYTSAQTVPGPTVSRENSNHTELTSERKCLPNISEPKSAMKQCRSYISNSDFTDLNKIRDKNTNCRIEQEQGSYKPAGGYLSTAQSFVSAGENNVGRNKKDKSAAVYGLVSSPPKTQLKFAGAGRAKMVEEARRSNFGRIRSGQGRGRGVWTNGGFK